MYRMTKTKGIFLLINAVIVFLIIMTPDFFINDAIRRQDGLILILLFGLFLFIFLDFGAASLKYLCFFSVCLYFLFTIYSGDEIIFNMTRIKAYWIKYDWKSSEIIDLFSPPFWLQYVFLMFSIIFFLGNIISGVFKKKSIVN